jgi:hypothetical protein
VLNALPRKSDALRATPFFALEGERLPPRSHAHAHAHAHACEHTIVLLLQGARAVNTLEATR